MSKITTKNLFLFIILICLSCNALAKSSLPPYNIIFIIIDQETHQLLNANNYELPARKALKAHGISFENHYAGAAMCSPSRATLLTGVPPQINHVFDQMEYAFVPELEPSRPNMGSVLKSLGYRTAYFGKFEMNKKLLINVKNTVNYSTLAKAYGFDVFNSDGDVGGQPKQGYEEDIYFSGEAIRWLRENVGKTSQPFFLVISLLNPHDIMYGDANIAGLPKVQQSAAHAIFPPPNNSIYKKNWEFSLPISLNESLKKSGMPNALWEYREGWSGALGHIPTERKDMWQYYYNYYLNALRDNDRSLQNIVDALNDMHLWENTIVILTADHGEMGGAHGGLRGKGPMAYEENAHIPLIVAHPKAPRGVQSHILTSHLDLLPTFIGLTGLSHNMKKEVLKGHDFSEFILHPENQNIHAIRKGILFNYVGISTIDNRYLSKMLIASFTHQSLPSLTEINLNKRGFLAFVFDGRYKFARFYSPCDFNTPTTLEEIFEKNDVQLFDLQNDPTETHNMALDKNKNKELILRMNELLNNLIAEEVGVNDGSFLPAEIRVAINRV